MSSLSKAPCSNWLDEVVASVPVAPYYRDDAVVIFNADCKEIVPQMPKACLLLTDPPYGINIASNPVRQKYAKMEWDADVPEAGLLPMLIEKADKSIIWGGNYFVLPPHQCFLAWDKMQPENFSLAMLEQAWTNLTGPAKMFRKRVVGYAKQHPTQKPVELMTWCISKAGDVQTILDPFMGSGTTLVAAKQLGRFAVGIEREEQYCEIAVKRLSQEYLPLSFPSSCGKTDKGIQDYQSDSLFGAS